MEKKKIILILLLSLTIFTGVVSKIIGISFGEITIHFLLFLFSGFAFAIHLLFFIVCPNPTCKSHQIFIGGILGWTRISWPGIKCYHCGTDLNAKYKDGRPIR